MWGIWKSILGKQEGYRLCAETRGAVLKSYLLLLLFYQHTVCCSAYQQAIIQFEAGVFEKKLSLHFVTSTCNEGLHVYIRNKLFWSCLIKYLHLSSVGTHNTAFIRDAEYEILWEESLIVEGMWSEESGSTARF